MRGSEWDAVRHSNHFYVKTFRKMGSSLVVSAALNVLLLLGIYYMYFNRPEHDFYSTNGVTPPVELVAMDMPNYTAVPLLANDPVDDDAVKALPK